MTKFFNLLLFVLFSPLTLWALSGEIHFTGEIKTLPTGQRSENSFQLASISLHDVKAFPSGAVLDWDLRLHHFELLSPEETKPAPQSHIFLDLAENPTAFSSFQVGLVPNPISMWSSQNWQADKMGTAGFSFTDRYGYFQNSDYGIAYYGSWSERETGRWGIRLVNGEGSKKQEASTQKDVLLWLQQDLNDGQTWAFSYTRGQYDFYSAHLGKKERWWFMWQKQWPENLQLSIEFFQAVDPANEVSDYFAEKVELTSVLGSSVVGQGLSVALTTLPQDQLQYFLRYDHLRPIWGKVLKLELKNYLVGLIQEISPGIQFLGSYEHQTYSQEYRLGARESGRLILSLAAAF
ncbi:MAG: hypothetical protein ACLGGX_04305 [Bdellovibrionia bacterium]